MTSPVLMGIIDDGIAFAHARFRKGPADSRVEFFWLQDGDPNRRRAGADFSDGFDLTKDEIDDLLATSTHGGMVDEDEVYLRAGLVDFHREGHNSAAWRAAHGTHVLDLAAGFDMREACEDRPIIAVQLPARVTADTSGGDLASYADQAIKYILHRAQAIGTRRGVTLPVVINFSYGKIAGPHDGTDPIEDLIEKYIKQAADAGVPLRVVLPAGNNYLARCHAELSFRRTGWKKSLYWRVLPDDRTPSYLEIWMPPRPAGIPRPRVTLEVTAPTGESKSIPDVHGQVKLWQGPNGDYAWLTYADMAPTARGKFQVMLVPTASHDPAEALAPAGVWTITMTNRKLGASETVHAWIQRDDSLYGHPLRGRQSYFDDPAYKRFDHAGREIETDDPACPVKRAGTLNAIATGASPVVMGGYLRHETAAAPYSAAGPTLAPTTSDRMGPDALAASERSRVNGGILAAGSRSASTVAMGGSSVAAPQLARLIADELAKAKPGDRDFVQYRASADEQGRPQATRPPLTRGGAGRIRPRGARLFDQ